MRREAYSRSDRSAKLKRLVLDCWRYEERRAREALRLWYRNALDFTGENRRTHELVERKADLKRKT